MLNNRQEIRARLEVARRELQDAQERVAMLEAQLSVAEPSPSLRLEQTSSSFTFDDLREGCQILGFDWRYLYLNDAAAAHGRQSKAALLGRTLLECYPGIEVSDLFATLQHCMRERTSAQIENEFVYTDGTRAWFELHIQSVPQGLFILSLDITARHQAEKQLQRLHRTLLVLSDINQAIVRIRHIPTLLQRACQIAVEKGNFRIAWIALFDSASATLQPVVHAAASAQDQEKLDKILGDVALVNGVLATMTLHKAPVILRTEAAWQAGYAASITLPLMVAGSARGALTLYTLHADAFDDAELRLLNEMADDLSFALEFAEQETQRQQAELAVRRYAERMEILHEIDRGIIEAQSIEAIIHSALRHIRQIIPCQRAGIALFDWENNEVVAYALDVPSGSASVPGLRGPMVSAAWLAEFNTKRVKIVDDLQSLADPLPIYHYAMRDGIRSVLHVLLVAEGHALGLFNLADVAPGFFTPDYEEIAAQVGYQLAIAIQQVRLTETLAYHTGMLEEHVAEIKRGQAALRRSEIYYRRILETAQEGVWLTSSTGKTIYANQAMADLLGYTVEEMLQVPLCTFVDQEGQVAIPRRLAERQQGQSEQYDIRLRRKDGSLVWVLINSTPLVEESGQIMSQVAMVADITERKQTEQKLQSLYAAINQHAAELESRVIARTTQLQAAKERVEAILNNSSDAILLLNRNLAIQQANRAFDQLFACQPADYLEQLLTAFVQPEDVRLLPKLVDAHLTDDPGQFIEIRARRHHGTLFHAEISIRTIHGAELVCTIRDITERKKVEEALQQALAKERELNELKSRFVSMASHEFRTPLAAILTLTETLSSYRTRMTDEQIDQRLVRIREQIGYLTEIMNDVLHLAQLQARRAEFNPALLDLDVLCRNVIDEFQSRPHTAHHFVYTCDPAIHEVRLDRKLMRQIISNLLSNAVKYSARDSLILIDLAYRAPYIVLKISDQGIGIPAKDIPHLFDPFHRAENVGTISGTGLGLTITKESVELHNGTITVESQEKVGTTFTIRLPLATT